MRARYQKGSLTKIKRKSGYLVWLFRWRETDPDGKRRPKKLWSVRLASCELRLKHDARWKPCVSISTWTPLNRHVLHVSLESRGSLSPQRVGPTRQRAEVIFDQERLQILPQKLDRTSMG